ncbi:MAG TPA: protein kinase, partial [Planctomycetaceae bacterium]|nr:protein kinase [Planctomycetaceae bacterium]
MPSIDEIYLAALEKPTLREQSAYLDEACAGDEEMRQRVERLLRVQPHIGDFLESPAPEIAVTVIDSFTERPGSVIGPYKLLEQIGEGGFGIVFMAEQQSPIRRRVALKIVKPGMDTRRVLARFKAELEALSLMDHPNIARALDAGATDSGRPYFVMELVRGVPITNYCDQNHLPVPERLELFVCVCRAVQHAHQKGIIHRDIKPSNVLVTLHDGRPVPKVIDFGVAKAIDRQLIQETLFTRFAEMIGTPLYMSPEQAEMSSLDIDTRADIYSLGVLLYELLTGSTPFTRERLQQAAFDEIRRIICEEDPPKPSTRISTLGNTRAAVAAQRRADPQRLSQLVRGDLDWIVMKTLEKDRTRRYETANGLAMDLQRYLADEPVDACPPSATYRFRKFARRNKAGLATGAVVLAALVAGTGVSTWQAIRATHAEQSARQSLQAESEAHKEAAAAAAGEKAQREIADVERAEAMRQRQAALRQLYLSQMTLAQQAWESGRVGRVMELLDGQRPLPGQQDLRDFDWYYRWRLCHSERLMLPRREDEVGSVAFSPDGKTLAISTKVIELWDLPQGRRLRATIKGHTSDINMLAFSPDGSKLASASDDNLAKIWDPQSGKELATLRGHSDKVLALAFSPDGKKLATCGYDGTVKLWPLEDLDAGGEIRPSLTLQHSLRTFGVAFSPDGRLLASTGKDRAVRLWDPVSGQLRATLEGHKDVLTPVVFSPNGKLLASGSDDTTIKLWDPVSGHELMTLTGHKDFVESLAFSPDGRFLASGSKDSTVRLWEVGSLDTANSSGGTAKSPAQPITEWTVFKGHTEGINSVAFSPDGKTLASASSDHTAKLWDVVRGQEHVTLAVNTGRLFMVAFSPDGRLLAAGGDDNVIRVWDATSRVLRKSLVGHEGRVTDLAFSPDGRQLVSGSWDKTVKIWDLNGGKERATLRGHNSIVHAIAISPDGKLIASGNSNIKIWDAVSGTGKFALHVAKSNYPDTGGLAFSPDSRALASGSSDEIVNIWDMPSGRRRPALEGHTGYIRTVAFSPDGKLLASADDASIRLWDFASGRSLHTLRGHTAPTVSVAFSPDSRVLASASSDTTIKLWDVGTGRHLVTLNGHT